jgi:hypothetical protein
MVYLVASLFSGKIKNINLPFVAITLLLVAYYWFL